MKAIKNLLVLCCLVWISLLGCSQDYGNIIGVYTMPNIGKFADTEIEFRSILNGGITINRSLTKNQSLQYLFMSGISLREIKYVQETTEQIYLDVINGLKYIMNQDDETKLKYYCALLFGISFHGNTPESSVIFSDDINPILFNASFSIGLLYFLSKRTFISVAPMLTKDLYSPIADIDYSENLGSSLLIAVQYKF